MTFTVSGKFSVLCSLLKTHKCRHQLLRCRHPNPTQTLKHVLSDFSLLLTFHSMFSWSFFCMQFSWADFWSPFQVRDMPLPSEFWVTCLTLLYLLCMHAHTHSCFSHVWVFATPWTVVCQAPLPMGFSRQEYWSGLSFASPGDLPNSGIKPRFPAFQPDTKPPGKSLIYVAINTIFLGSKRGSLWLMWILSLPCTCLFWNASFELGMAVSYMALFPE